MKYCFTLIFVTCLSALASDGSMVSDSSNQINDADYAASETYIHQGKVNSTWNKDSDFSEVRECFDDEGRLTTLCSSADYAGDDESSFQKLEQYMPMVSQMYSLLGNAVPLKFNDKRNGARTFTDSKGGVWRKNGNGKEGVFTNEKQPDKTYSSAEELKNKEDVKNNTKEGQDYCAIIPTATETAANFFMQQGAQQTQQNIENAPTQSQQAASLYGLAELHEQRKKGAKVQGYGWTTTAGCYAAMMLSNTMVPNVSAIAKTSAATFLSWFYLQKAKFHKDKAEKLKNIAATLPGAGDCNPYTKTSCFCSEESSFASDPTNYQRFCVPPTFGNNYDPVESFVCVDANQKVDPKCDCKATNTCINATLAKIMKASGLPPTMIKDPLKGISPLSTGYGVGSLSNANRANSAMAKKALKKFTPKKNFNLTNNQKKIAKKLAESGVPTLTAAYSSKAPFKSNGSLPSSLSTASFSPSKNKNSAYRYRPRKKNKKQGYKSGGKVAQKRKSKSRSSYSKSGSRGNAGGGIEIIDGFSEQASREAQITKDRSKPIFDIITYRYKLSAWREFKDTIEKESQK